MSHHRRRHRHRHRHRRRRRRRCRRRRRRRRRLRRRLLLSPCERAFARSFNFRPGVRLNATATFPHYNVEIASAVKYLCADFPSLFPSSQLRAPTNSQTNTQTHHHGRVQQLAQASSHGFPWQGCHCDRR